MLSNSLTDFAFGFPFLNNKDIFLHFLLIEEIYSGEDSGPAGRRSVRKGQNSHLAITALSISLPPSLYSGQKAKIPYPSVPCSWGLACESVSSIYMHLCEIGKMGVKWSSHSSTYQNHWRSPPGNFAGVGQGPQIFIASKFACDTQTRVQLLLSRFVSVPGVFRVGRGHSGSRSFLTSESYLW